MEVPLIALDRERSASKIIIMMNLIVVRETERTRLRRGESRLSFICLSAFLLPLRVPLALSKAKKNYMARRENMWNVTATNIASSFRPLLHERRQKRLSSHILPSRNSVEDVRIEMCYGGVKANCDNPKQADEWCCKVFRELCSCATNYLINFNYSRLASSTRNSHKSRGDVDIISISEYDAALLSVMQFIILG